MKKLTAGIFTVLMGLVSVNAADAAVASKGYVDAQVKVNADAISTLTTTVTDNKTAADTAIAEAKKAGTGAAAALESYKTTNDAAVATKVAQTDYDAKIAELEEDIAGVAGGDLQLGADAVGTTNIVNGAVTEEKLDEALAIKINGKEDVGVAAGLIEGLDVTDTAVAGEYVSAVSETDGKISVTRVALPTVDQTVVDGSTNAVSGEAVQTYVGGQISSISQGNADAIAKVNQAISDLDDAKADKATTLAGYGITDAYTKTEANTEFMDSEEVDAKITAAVADNGAVKSVVDAAVSGLANGAVKDNADAIKAIQESEYATSGITATLVEKYNAYEQTIADNATAATNAASAAETNARTYTDTTIANLKLNELSRVPAECGEAGKYCALTSDGTNYLWEVIERATGETQPDGTPIPTVIQ